MSKDQRIADSFGENFNDEDEDPAHFENLRRVQVGRNMQNRPGTVYVTSREPPSGPFHGILGPRNPMIFDMVAEGGQNVVRSSMNMQQSAEYFLLQRTSNKRNISNTNDSLSECSISNKKMRCYEINYNENSCQPLDLSMRGASFKTDGENSSCQKTQTNTSASSALSSSKKSRNRGRKHVCDVCKKEFPFLSLLKARMRIHTGEKPFVCNTCKMAFTETANLEKHMRIHSGEKPYSCEICQRKFNLPFSLNRHSAIHSETKIHCDC